VLEIIKKRQFLENLDRIIEVANRTKQATPMYITVRESFLAVYLNNVSKIGTLPGRLPTEISRIYGILFSVLEDLKYLNEVNPNSAGDIAEWTRVTTTQRNVRDWAAQLIDAIEKVLPKLAQVGQDYPE
jgi:hypothetical protein